jgi:hypothetical protein
MAPPPGGRFVSPCEYDILSWRGEKNNCFRRLASRRGFLPGKATEASGNLETIVL